MAQNPRLADAAAIRLGGHYLASAPAWFASTESERDTGAYAAAEQGDQVGAAAALAAVQSKLRNERTTL